MTLPAELVRRAKIIAAARDTSVSALVAEYLAALAQRDDDYEQLWSEDGGGEGIRSARPLLVSSMEALAQTDRSEEARASLADGLRQGREGLAELFGIPEDDLRGPLGSFLRR